MTSSRAADLGIQPYPWQKDLWRSLQQRITGGRLPHALLFSGPAGLGKLHLARVLASFLLCAEPENAHPCGHCRACQLFHATTHPDFRQIQPEEEGRDITIGMIRELLEWQSLTPQYGRARIILLEPAERMNPNAANALLKTLEEPGENVLLILLTATPARLLPTIRSRCQQMVFPLPEAADVLPWLTAQLGDREVAGQALQASGLAPLRAMELATGEGLQLRKKLLDEFLALLDGRVDPLVLAGTWHKQPLQDLLARLHGWHVDMARLKVSSTPERLDNPDLQQHLQVGAEQVHLAQLLVRQQQIQAAIQQLRHGNPNTQLVLEELLLGWIPGTRHRQGPTR